MYVYMYVHRAYGLDWNILKVNLFLKPFLKKC